MEENDNRFIQDNFNVLGEFVSIYKEIRKSEDMNSEEVRRKLDLIFEGISSIGKIPDDMGWNQKEALKNYNKAKIILGALNVGLTAEDVLKKLKEEGFVK